MHASYIYFTSCTESELGENGEKQLTNDPRDDTKQIIQVL